MKRGEKRIIPMIGKQFGELTVLSRDMNATTGHSIKYICKCSCGKIKSVRGSHLRDGRIISCGHIGQEHSIAARTKHGGAGTRLYYVWCDMKNRCNNTKVRSYKDYGGRGIRVCDEWLHDFKAFREWAYSSGYDEAAPYGQCTIERIDVNGNYCPDNCTWVTAKEQAQNKRAKAVPA